MDWIAISKGNGLEFFRALFPKKEPEKIERLPPAKDWDEWLEWQKKERMSNG